jgi:release factor glutamine methyltransferase
MSRQSLPALELKAGVTIAVARRAVASAFAAAGLETPELDARLIVGCALGLDHAALAAAGDHRLAGAETNAVAALAVRRLAREPVARILGRKEFWGLPFKLNAETLVPRPETETVVEAALAALDRREQPGESLRIADLGTGSGALLLALLSELPAAWGIATDISVAALTCARANAMMHGCVARAAFVASDYGAAIAGPVDLIVCNPPYIAHAEIAALQPEVRAFDPIHALDGGPDGLDSYRAVAADARRLLSPDGILVLELGKGQVDSVTSLFEAARLRAAGPPRCDLGGVARALVVKPLP